MTITAKHEDPRVGIRKTAADEYLAFFLTNDDTELPLITRSTDKAACFDAAAKLRRLADGLEKLGRSPESGLFEKCAPPTSQERLHKKMGLK